MDPLLIVSEPDADMDLNLYLDLVLFRSRSGLDAANVGYLGGMFNLHIRKAHFKDTQF